MPSWLLRLLPCVLLLTTLMGLGFFCDLPPLDALPPLETLMGLGFLCTFPPLDALLPLDTLMGLIFLCTLPPLGVLPALGGATGDGIFGEGFFGRGIFGDGIFGDGVFGEGFFGEGFFGRCFFGGNRCNTQRFENGLVRAFPGGHGARHTGFRELVTSEVHRPSVPGRVTHCLSTRRHTVFGGCFTHRCVKSSTARGARHGLRRRSAAFPMAVRLGIYSYLRHIFYRESECELGVPQLTLTALRNLRIREGWVSRCILSDSDHCSGGQFGNQA